MKYIYGPVPSWRLGRSLGIDLISQEKTCSFGCIYCQLGKTVKYTGKRQVFVSTASMIANLKKIPQLEVDYITFSGTGEPTLAKNLGEAISEVKKRFKTKVAVLTNSSLMVDPQVRAELSLADLVVAKLDAPNEEIFKLINRPIKGISLRQIVEGIKKFNHKYPGKLALQIMFVPQNKAFAQDLANLTKDINPIEIEINTPLRPSPIKPLSIEELSEIKKLFSAQGGLKVYSVYDVERPEVKSLDTKETLRRRPEMRG